MLYNYQSFSEEAMNEVDSGKKKLEFDPAKLLPRNYVPPMSEKKKKMLQAAEDLEEENEDLDEDIRI